jgi:hypothetical protein
MLQHIYINQNSPMNTRKAIELTGVVFDRLARHARPFETPSDLIGRLLDDFENNETRTQDALRTTAPATDELQALSNGEIQNRISRVLANMPKEDVDRFCDKNYSKQIFRLNLPLLIRVPLTAGLEARRVAVKDKGINRWTWKYSFIKENDQYAISTQWFPSNHDAVRNWLSIHESQGD